MCGIAGTFQSKIDHSFYDQSISNCLLSLSKRGPDSMDFATYKTSGGYLSLLHTRLSIIDLTPAGRQPMVSTDGKFIITFNGEIFNFKDLRNELIGYGFNFVSATDTEVLLTAWSFWGINSFPKLQGMFALAIYSIDDHRLILARDAFGIKPLVYHHSPDDNFFAFSSDLNSLMNLLPFNPRPSIQRCLDYLSACSYDDSQSTFYESILTLEPSHYITLDLDNCMLSRPIRWWKPSIVEDNYIDSDCLISSFRDAFLSNIHLHLGGDVPVAAALSGGLDSSSIVCSVRHLEPDLPIHTFTYEATGYQYNESRWAAIVNSHVGAVPHSVSVSESQLAEDLDHLIFLQGEPFMSASVLAQYHVFREVSQSGFRVCLDGQGADELLAGYSGYPQFRLRSLLDQRQLFKAAKLLFNIQSSASSSFLFSTVIRLFSQPSSLSGLRDNLFFRNCSWLNQSFLITHDLFSTTSRINPFLQDPFIKGRRLVDELRHCLTGHGLASLLRHSDRSSMACSVESRVPFLTTQFVQKCLSLPESFLLSDSYVTKYILREAMRGIVPDQILDRKDKIGFVAPEQFYLMNLGSYISNLAQQAASVPFINSHKFASDMALCLSNNRRFPRKTWRFINLLRWLEINSLSF